MGVHGGASPARRDDRVEGSLPTVVSRLPGWVADHTPASFRHATAVFDGAHAMDVLTFQQHVFDAYQTVLREIDDGAPNHLVRFWAFIPGIHDDLGAGLDRYMAFNAGRYAAFSSHYRRPTAFDRSVPTASAVGVEGDLFVLHCLASAHVGRPVENPRQVSAYHYSRRFGPMPPCFARATLLQTDDGQPLLLVGGTASITGEESRHLGNVHQQACETFRNLGNVLAAAAGVTLAENASVAELRSLLADFVDIRVYYTREADSVSIANVLSATFPATCRIEMLQASLCRSELLVEIEGIARLRCHVRAVDSGRVLGR